MTLGKKAVIVAGKVCEYVLSVISAYSDVSILTHTNNSPMFGQ